MEYVLSSALISRQHTFNGIPIVTYIYNDVVYITFMEFIKGTGGNIRSAIRKSAMEYIIKIDNNAAFPVYLIGGMPSWYQRVYNFLEVIGEGSSLTSSNTNNRVPTLVPDKVYIEVTKSIVPDEIINICVDIDELMGKITKRHTQQRRDIDSLAQMQTKLSALVAKKDQSTASKELKYYSNFQFNDVWGVTAFIRKTYPKGPKREAFVQELGSKCVEMSAQMDAEVRKEKIPEHLLKKYTYDNEYRGVYREDVSRVVYQEVFGPPMNQLRKVQ